MNIYNIRVIPFVRMVRTVPVIFRVKESQNYNSTCYNEEHKDEAIFLVL